MTIEEAKEVFINRGFVNGIFDGDKWRESVAVISKWLEQEPKPMVEIDLYSVIKQKYIEREVLDKIRTEIMDTGAYEQETMGQTEFLKGINYCLGVIDKYKAESEGKYERKANEEKSEKADKSS